jgi:diacylglycerol kinase family enzyme
MEDGFGRHAFVLSIRGIRAIRGQNVPPLKTRFIVNLRSGRAARAIEEIRAFAARHDASLALTERTRHASELAARALTDGCELIVAVGGDGTMNEIASTLVGTHATLGLIPCGSGDGLGRHLRIHGSVTRALDILHTGRPQWIDTGFADGHPFFTAAGIGFEAEIAHRFNRLQRRGFFRYLTTSARAYRGWQPQDYTIAHDDTCERVRAFTLVVANTDQYGNNARIAPGARVDDGLLDLCAVPPIGVVNALPLAVRLFGGTMDRAHHVLLRRSARFVVERAAPGLLHTDGEIHDAGARIEFSVRPRSLRIMAPVEGAHSSAP